VIQVLPGISALCINNFRSEGQRLSLNPKVVKTFLPYLLFQELLGRVQLSVLLFSAAS
jgi:hypothetical protein